MPTFPRYFNAEDLGKSLKEVATDLIATTGDYRVVSRWFHSSKDADLFIWIDAKENIIKQQISFYGQVVEWNVVEGLKTGLVVEDESPKDIKSSEIIHFDLKPQMAPLEQARSLLKHVPALNDLEKARLLSNFAGSVDLPAVDPEDFVKRFGAFLERPAPAKPGFWRRLRRLLGGL